MVKACEKLKIKLIYFSSSYVYPGKKGGYRENDPVLPINNYAWSKLGGECSVKLYKNSLIVRASMTEKPFIHKAAFSDFLTNFIFHEDIAPKVFKFSDDCAFKFMTLINVSKSISSPSGFTATLSFLL